MPLRSPLTSTRFAPERRSREAYWLFFLFAMYGPSVNIIGEFRYVEIVVIAIVFMHVDRAIRNLTKVERIFIYLLFLTALMHVFSDFVNAAEIEGTLKRGFTYILLALLVMAMRYLSRGDARRLRWMIAGYCLSYVTVLYIGQTASLNYASIPWRLGLGMAATMAICLVPFWFPRLTRYMGPALMVMGAFHWANEARALAVLTLAAGSIAMAAWFFGRSVPLQWKPRRVLGFALLGLSAFLLTEIGLRAATEAQLLPPGLQEKTEAQLNSPFGLIGGGRPDTITAIYAISRQPFLGYGSTNVDPEVLDFYRQINIAVDSTFLSLHDAVARAYAREWILGTPSHSHLFGAWADAGILAALSWAFYLGLAIYILQRSLLWRHPYQPLFVLTCLFIIWDTLFSPGPIRFDVAMRFSILMLAMQTMSDRTPSINHLLLLRR